MPVVAEMACFVYVGIITRRNKNIDAKQSHKRDNQNSKSKRQDYNMK